MMLRIQGYDLHIVYKKGKEMTLADTLSRAYINRPSEQQDIETINHLDFILIRPERLEKLKEATAQDENLQTLKAVIMEGWPEDKSKALYVKVRTSFDVVIWLSDWLSRTHPSMRTI